MDKVRLLNFMNSIETSKYQNVISSTITNWVPIYPIKKCYLKALSRDKTKTIIWLLLFSTYIDIAIYIYIPILVHLLLKTQHSLISNVLTIFPYQCKKYVLRNPLIYFIFYLSYMPNQFRWSLIKLRFYRNLKKNLFSDDGKLLTNSIWFSRIYLKWSCNFSIHDQEELNQIKRNYVFKLCFSEIMYWPNHPNIWLLFSPDT